MKRNLFTIVIPPLLVMTVFSGCATTRPKKADTMDPNQQISALQSELAAKDQQIQDLQYQVQNNQESLPSTNFAPAYPVSSATDRYNLLRVSGVSEIEVQKALSRAGFDPGPIDGRLGRKTKAAIKAFQRRHNLTADGVVGEKTWAALRSA